MDGLETLAEIRRRDATLPVLILSGHADLASVASALQKGIANFISKPCAVEVLVAAIEDAQERKALAQSARRLRLAVPCYADTAYCGSCPYKADCSTAMR
jgi:DNA-binding NtrC family response regulator